MESWPRTIEPFEISPEQVRRNLETVRAMLRERDLDALVVTSADRHLNEYTPREDNHRYHLSRFTGSTALMLVPREGKAKLYVDGRYHLQADQEVDAELIEVAKVRLGTMLGQSLVQDLRAYDRIAYEGDRVPMTLADAIDKAVGPARVTHLDDGEITSTLGRKVLEHQKPLRFVDRKIAGRSVAEKLEAVFAHVEEPKTTAILLCALDDIAWLTEGRGYHFEYQSSFAGVGFATLSHVDVSVDHAVFEQGFTGAPAEVQFRTEAPEKALVEERYATVKTLLYDRSQVTGALLRRLERARPDLRMVPTSSPVVAARALKTAAEIQHFEEINRRSCRAIVRTQKWVWERMAQGEVLRELDFYEAANRHYEEEGARDLSFQTIAAVGSNTAIIHFSDPRAEVVARPEDLLLLDSGALYEGGFATDITRTFLAGGPGVKALPRQREVYTLVLKGILRGMMAVFPEGTRGSFLDALCRAPIYAGGYDYAHGTGHGVGIHVHEPGVGLGPSSTLPIRAGHVCSIEPGIYLEGFGGVRLENVVVFEACEDQPGFLRSRPLNYVGFDPRLADLDRLDPVERDLFDAYEAECVRRGTSFTES